MKPRRIAALALSLGLALFCAAAHAVPVHVASPHRDPHKLAL